MKQKIKSVFLFSTVMLAGLLPTLAWGATTGTNTGLVLTNDFNMPSGTISGILTNLLNWLLLLFGIFGVLGFVISGIMYLTSTGDEGQIDRAKSAMLYSIVGVLVGLIGYIVLQAVKAMLNATAGF